MTIDLEERLRRAATVLDDHIAAHSVSAPYHDVRTPRWWRPGLVAAAAVLAVSAASFAVLVSRDSVETVPSTEATSDQSALPTSVPDSGSVSREGWSPLATAPIAPRGGHLAVSTESGLFVWGGYDRATSLADGAYYDSPTDTWQIVPEGPLAGQSSVMGVWTGLEVVVVFEAGDRLKTAAFDPVAFSWRELPDAPLVNAAGSMNRVLMWKGTVVVVEAVEDDSDRTTNAVARLDLATEQWVTAAESIPPFGMNFEAVAAGDQIFVVADGTNGSPCGQTVLAYDPAADRWREVPAPIPDQVASPVVAWTGTELFVGGGYECGTNGRTVKSAVLLEPATGAWRSAVSAPIGIQPNEDYPEIWTGVSVLVVTGDDVPLVYNPSADAWHVGPAGPLAVPNRASYANPWSWVNGRLVLFSGATVDSSPTGSLTGEPVDGGAAYTPPPGF